MAYQEDRSEALAKLWALIKDMRAAMMTTWDGERMRSRPMHGFQDAFQGELWFFTHMDSGKTREVERYDQLNLAYVDPAENTYVSISGQGEVSRDRGVMEKYWSSAVAAWFEKGLDDPDIALIKVTVEDAEYWDMTASRMRYLWETGRASVSTHTPELGEQAKIKVR